MSFHGSGIWSAQSAPSNVPVYWVYEIADASLMSCVPDKAAMRKTVVNRIVKEVALTFTLMHFFLIAFTSTTLTPFESKTKTISIVVFNFYDFWKIFYWYIRCYFLRARYLLLSNYYLKGMKIGVGYHINTNFGLLLEIYCHILRKICKDRVLRSILQLHIYNSKSLFNLD